MEIRVAVALGLLLTVHAAGMAQPVTPIQKSIELLTQLQEKVTAEGEARAKLHQGRESYCGQRTFELNHGIEQKTTRIGVLEAEIQSERGEVITFENKMRELEQEKANTQESEAAAEATRNEEIAAYKEGQLECAKIAEAIMRAIGILEKNARSGSLIQFEGAASLTQALSVMVEAAELSSADATRLTALVQENQNQNIATNEPIYQSDKSDKVIEALEDLQERCERECRASVEIEADAKANYAVLQHSFLNQVETIEKHVADLQDRKELASKKAAEGESQLARASANRDQDSIALKDTQKGCIESAQNFDLLEKRRMAELGAIGQALTVLIEQSKGAESKTYGMTQVSLIQQGHQPKDQFGVVRQIRKLARSGKSKALAQLASQVNAALKFQSGGNGGFDTVVKMISKMIESLTDQSRSEMTKKMYCDEQVGSNERDKIAKQRDLDTQNLKLNELAADVQLLKEQVTEYNREIVATRKQLDDEFAMRNAESDEYATCKQDMQQGIDAVDLALKVLKDFYRGSDDASKASGVVGMLELIQSDFSKTLAEITAVEESAQASYQESSEVLNTVIGSRTAEVVVMTVEIKNLAKSAEEKTTDRDRLREDLQQTLAILEKLQDDCTTKVDTYDQRQKRLENEINGLRRALQVFKGLQDDAASFLQKSMRG